MTNSEQLNDIYIDKLTESIPQELWFNHVDEYVINWEDYPVLSDNLKSKSIHTN